MAFRIPRQGPDRTIVDELAGVLRRRKVVVLATMIGMTLAVYVGLWLVAERYEAEARLLVMLGRENVEVPITVQKGGVYAAGVQREEINSYIQLLKSRRLIEDAVDAVGVARFRFEPPAPRTLWERIKYTARQAVRWVKDAAMTALIRLSLKQELTDQEKAVKLVHGSLDVSREAESNVIRVALRLPSKEVAIMTVGAILDLYFHRHVSLRATATVLPVLEKQTDVGRAELTVLQEERRRTLREWGLNSVERQRAQLLERLHKVRYEADGKRSELEAAQERLAVLKARVASLPANVRERETVEPNPSVRTLKERLVELRLKRIDMASRYKGADMPLVKRIDEEIAALEGLLGKEESTQQGAVTYQPNPVRLTLEQQAEAIAVAISGLRAAIREDEQHARAVEADLARVNEGESRLRMVDLKLQVAEKKFVTDSSRRDEALMAEELDRRRVANVGVLSAPTAAPEPVSPRKLRTMGLGVLAGLLVGVGLAMVLEWGDDTIYGPAELARATNAPFLGQFQLERMPAIDARINGRTEKS